MQIVESKKFISQIKINNLTVNIELFLIEVIDAEEGKDAVIACLLNNFVHASVK